MNTFLSLYFLTACIAVAFSTSINIFSFLHHLFLFPGQMSVAIISAPTFLARLSVYPNPEPMETIGECFLSRNNKDFVGTCQEIEVLNFSLKVHSFILGILKEEKSLLYSKEFSNPFPLYSFRKIGLFFLFFLLFFLF